MITIVPQADYYQHENEMIVRSGSYFSQMPYFSVNCEVCIVDDDYVNNERHIIKNCDDITFGITTSLYVNVSDHIDIGDIKRICVLRSEIKEKENMYNITCCTTRYIGRIYEKLAINKFSKSFLVFDNNHTLVKYKLRS